MDFGRVGHIRSLDTDAVFMVIGESNNPDIRRGMPHYRMVINLSGVGYIAGDRIDPGMIAPVLIDREIEWLDD